MTETIDPKYVRVGDRVTVSGVVNSVGPGDVHINFGDMSCWVPRSSITSITRPIDPDVLLVRRVVSELWPGYALQYESGEYDSLPEVKAALAVAKEIRKEYEK